VHADLAPLLPDLIADARVDEPTEPATLQERIPQELRRVVRKKTARRPMVLPVVMEI
jgi:mRNA degradation ribonuclease J1/J2